MTKALQMIISAFIYLGRRDISIIWETGHSIFWEKGHFILWETGNSILWERFYPLVIEPLILCESDHLSSVNRTTYPLGFGTSSGKRDLENGTRYSLGIGPLMIEFTLTVQIFGQKVKFFNK